MKSILFLFFFLFSSLLINGQGIHFETGNLASAIAKAKLEKKNLFIDCSTVWCKPCKWMEANVFPLAPVGQFYNEHYVSLHMDMEKGEGITLRKKFQVNAYPTYLYLDTAGNLLHRDGGAKDADKFITIGKRALDPANNLEGMNKEYEAGNRSQGFLRRYIIALGHAHEKSKQNKVFKAYYNARPTSKMFNEKDFDVIMSVADITDTPFLFVLQHHEKFQEIVGKEKLDFSIYAKFIFPFSQMVYKDEVEAMKNEASKYKAYFPFIVQKAEDMAMIRWYRKQKLTLPLSNACVSFVQKYSPDSPDDIYYCMNMVLNAPDMEKDNYKDALELTENAVKRFPSNLLLRDAYAGLLYKSGNKEDALTEAKKVLADCPENKQAKLWSKKLLEKNISKK